MSTAQPFLDVALAAARAGAAICEQVQKQLVRADGLTAKAGAEPVTIADYASQAIINHFIADAFPKHAVISEESSKHLRGQADAIQRWVAEVVSRAASEAVSFDDLCRWLDHRGDENSEWRWTIDPIDGTKGFLRSEQYAVAIGLVRDGTPHLGVLACPSLASLDGSATGVLLHAVRGAGAYEVTLSGLAARRIQASTCTEAHHARMLGSVEAAHGDPELLTRLAERLQFREVIRVDSQAKYAVLARGGAEIYLRPRSKPAYRDNAWDHAAGALIAEEAGARITDVRGKALNFGHGAKLEDNEGVLATNGPLHDQILSALDQLR
jgi:3'(2'), 5'-bisphosphate nucleotidase